MNHEPGVMEWVQGDITEQRVDVIVNAANRSLLGGGGVDGAIHRAAGPLLLDACRRLGGCETGQAKITPGFQLPARFVIHTVGPVYQDGRHGEPEQLAACYRNSLCLAADHQLSLVAFPAISTGIYGYPMELAAPLAVQTVAAVLHQQPTIRRVRFVLFTSRDAALYASLLNRL
ncbi:MAG: O-acetyl-ADP-ribose deacetylase [Candidatus Delongbacteria bacterium]|nr:O-acetyl-ADP-ribose deacetylase [Candidatus Delongbacteria bacterium]